MGSRPREYRIREYADGDVFPFHIGGATVDGRFHEHTHDFVELVVIRKGSGRHLINGRPYRVAPGDVSVFNLGAAHGFDSARGLEMVNVMYAPSLLAGAGPDLRALPGFQALFAISPTPGADYRCAMRLDRAGLARVSAVLKRMTEEFAARRPGHQTLLRSMLLELVVYLSRRYSDRGVSVEGPPGALRLAEVAGYMAVNFREPLGLQALADRAGLSRRHFIRLFRRVYGTTPRQHVVALRLQHAAALLGGGERSVTRVAFESGFSDSNYFTRRFTKQFGAPPGRFRSRRPGSRAPAPRA
jgi:AraC-like DNA-binding protein